LLRSLIDLKQAGVGMMDFIFEPEIEAGEQAAGLVNELIQILRLILTYSCKNREKIHNSCYLNIYYYFFLMYVSHVIDVVFYCSAGHARIF
jgi:hypothetical protein